METSLLRSFRSADFRDLARLAVRQGWDAYLRPGGHVDIVNPSTGAVVQMSTTAHTAGPVLAGKRHEFEKAGLLIGGPHRTRRAVRAGRVATIAPIPEEPTMELPNGAAETPAFPILETIQPKLHGNRRAGGQYAWRGAQDVVQIEDRRVHVGQRVDGKWAAFTRDKTMASGRRQWIARDDETGREPFLERIAHDLRTGVIPRHRQRPTTPQAVPVIPGSFEVSSPVPAAVEPETPRATSTGQNGAAGHDVRWSAVGIDPTDFPLAAALDDLHAAMGPALVALEAAGKGDAAALLRAELDLTPVEAELMRLWRLVVRTE